MLAYTTDTAMLDPSCICNLHCSSWQYWILNPMSGARDQTCNLMDTSWVHYLLSHNRNSLSGYFWSNFPRFFANPFLWTSSLRSSRGKKKSLKAALLSIFHIPNLLTWKNQQLHLKVWLHELGFNHYIIKHNTRKNNVKFIIMVVDKPLIHSVLA